MLIYVALLYLFCASSFTIAKAVLQYSPPIFFVAARMILGGIVLWIINAATSKGSFWKTFFSSNPLKDYWLFLQAALFHVYFAYIFDLWALEHLSSFKSSFFFNLSPFITAILSYFILDDKLTQKKFIGMVVGFVGFAPLLMQSMSSEGDVYMFAFSRPELYMLICVTAAAYGWITFKRLLDRGYSPLHINAVAMTSGGLLALATSTYYEQWSGWAFPVSDWPMFLGLTALIIVVCNGIFYNLYGYLMKKYSVTFLSFAGFSVPFFALLLGWVFLGERPTWHFFASSIIVGTGLYLFYSDEKRGLSTKKG